MLSTALQAPMDVTSKRFWSVEEACMNAWPSSRQILMGGWLMRLSGGSSRRINSINPIRSGCLPPVQVAAVAGPIYREANQALLFRIPLILPRVARSLERLGLQPEGETQTLYRELNSRTTVEHESVRLTPDADTAWLEARAIHTGSTDAARRADRAVLAGLLVPRAFAALQDDSHTVAIAFAAIHRELLVLEAVSTLPGYRGRGYGRQIVAALTDWGLEHGARGACLQVLADNMPGKALYASAGFHQDLYRYRYYRQPKSG